MNTKYLLCFLMASALACKADGGIGGGEGGTTAGGENRGRTDAGVVGTGGTIVPTGGSGDLDGGAAPADLPDAAGTDGPTGAAGTGGLTGAAGTGGATGVGGAGGLTNMGGTSKIGGMATAGSIAIGGTGGLTGTGAAAGATSSAPLCPNGTVCGGDLVGTWQVSSSCLALSGDMDVSMLGIGCRTVPVTGSLQVTGAWTAKSNGTYRDTTITKGSMTFPLAPSCLSVASVPVLCDSIGAIFGAMGWTDTTCSQTGDQCFCKAQTTLVGGLGVPSPFASDAGDYTTSGGVLNVDTLTEYSYCIAGSKLTLTPKPTSLPVKGTIVLQKNGGAGGSGGATGGTVGSGGAKGGAGGTSRSGTGGATGGAGGTSKAGSTGTGGACASSAACGGDVVGTWSVKSSCLQASGQADITFIGLGCSTAEVAGSASVTGSLTFTAAGKYTDQTITSGSDTWVLDPKCQVLSGTRVSCDGIGSVLRAVFSSYGYQSFSCVDQATGSGCLCQGSFNQIGGMGMLVMDPTSPWNYKLSGNTLTRDDTITYSYCVTGKEMTASPQPMNGPPYKGTIVLQKFGASPDGGAP